MKCNNCGEEFNEADLSEVFKHEHANIEVPRIIGKKVISHASEIYPNCGGEFAGGVHSYLQGDEVPRHPDPNDFRRGYFTAKGHDLNSKYVLR